MYLKTPKRYTAKGSRRRLISLRWLWLYLLAPVIIIPSALAWQYRDEIGGWIGQRVDKAGIFRPPPPTPTPTPTLPPNPAGELENAYKAGRIGKAVDILRTIAMSVPNDVITRSLAAQTLTFRSHGQNEALLEQAIEMATDAINANPERAEGWIAMALALDWSERYSEALGYILHARDLAPDDPMLLTVTAEIYGDLGKLAEANDMIDEAIEAARSAKPVNRDALAHAYYVKGLLIENTPDTLGQDAIDQYEQAWRVVTSEPVDLKIPVGYIAQTLGVRYRLVGETDKAVNILAAGIERDREDPVLYYWLGSVYSFVGEYDKSRQAADQCRDINPDQMSCIQLLSILLYRDRNYQQTIDVLERAVGLGTTDPEDYLRLALSYISGQNNCEKAVPILQKGAEFIPTDNFDSRVKFEDVMRTCGATLGIAGSSEQPAVTEEPVATEASAN